MRTAFYAVLWAVLFHSFNANAQCNQSITLSTQAEVDSFQCTEVTGNLIISGSDITNLNGLSSLKRVGSLTIINNDNLSNLDGLSSLESIVVTNGAPGALSITNNESLININGLSSLHEISGDPVSFAINIAGNSALRTVDGLISIKTLSNSLMIGGNTALENVDGLRGLESMSASNKDLRLLINGNPSLTNIDGLSALRTMSGGTVSLSISNNSSIIDIDGLASLTSISASSQGSLSIGSNPLLKNLDGLSSLSAINWTSGGYIEVVNNGALDNVDGLSSLVTVQNLQSVHLNISGNPMLTRCCGLFSLLRQFQLGADINSLVTITGNGAACTVADITANGPCDACPGPRTLSSQAQVDAFNCVAIAGDLTISGSDITNLDGLQSLKTVEGNLFIVDNANLIDINGLANLTFVDGMVKVSNNVRLTNLDSLPSLASVGFMPIGFISVMISDNPALISIEGLSSLTTSPGNLEIVNNASLPDLDGLQSLTKIGLPIVRVASLLIENNPSLANIDALSSLKSVGGYYFGQVQIENNPSLGNLDGLSSLTTINGGINAGLTIVNNASLTNVDGLSSFVNIQASQGFIDVEQNANLTRGCGLYPILHNSDLTGFPIATTMSGNGAGISKAEILAGGLCPEAATARQPSDLVISFVTDRSMKLSFTQAALIPKGYITLMRAFGSPSPDEIPVDGTVYHVGSIIGINTTVVGLGPERSLDVTSLIPNTNYYFEIYSYYEGNDYVTQQPLAGHQVTTDVVTTSPPDPTIQASDLQFSDITNASLVVSFTAPVELPDGYITLMRAVTPPFPEDVPMSETNYRVGDVIGGSTIVVGLGPATSFSVEYLLPGTEYFFDVYAYRIPDGGGPIFLVTGTPLSGSVTTNFSASQEMPYPNPFLDEVTIPFTVQDENTLVQVAIVDMMGNKVADLVSRPFGRGHHEVTWNGTNTQGGKVKQGLYIYSVRTGDAGECARGTLVAK